MDRENEEGRDDDHPGNYQHRDLDEIIEEVDRADELFHLHQKRKGGLESGSREPARHQQILRADRAAARGQSQSGETAEDDVGEERKAVQYQREGADIENLLQKLADEDRKSTRLNSSH